MFNRCRVTRATGTSFLEDHSVISRGWLGGDAALGTSVHAAGTAGGTLTRRGKAAKTRVLCFAAGQTS